MIDLATSDNLLLKLSTDLGYASNEGLISVSYSPMKGSTISLFFSFEKSNFRGFFSSLGIIAAGTNRGSIAFWTYMPNRRTTDVEKHWVLQRAKQLTHGVAVRRLKVRKTHVVSLH